MNHPAPWSSAFAQTLTLFTQRWLRHLARWINESFEPLRALQRAPALIPVPVRHREARGRSHQSRRP